MSELLQNWLNNEVGLSTNVSNFEKDFSSGYLFGEILHKFWQADFEQFQNKNSHQAKIANFKTLEPILKALGIKFNATLINAVMNGKLPLLLLLLLLCAVDLLAEAHLFSLSGHPDLHIVLPQLVSTSFPLILGSPVLP
mmetsp:Transcript_15780/g.18413  ORF Transcript_15780/g.18413 Transcript_15780/m.18413 type:complete len:139 (-) Transcript_15780:201-617(-)